MLETPKAIPSLQVEMSEPKKDEREEENSLTLPSFIFSTHHVNCCLAPLQSFIIFVIFFPSLNCYHKHSLLLYKRVNSSLVFLLSLRGEISVPGRLVCLPLSKQNWKTLRKSISKHLWLSEVYFCVGSILIVHYLIIIQYADQWGVRSIIVI